MHSDAQGPELTTWNSLAQLWTTLAGQAMRQVGECEDGSGKGSPFGISAIAVRRARSSGTRVPFLPIKGSARADGRTRGLTHDGGEESDDLDRLAESHIISQDPSLPVLVLSIEEVDSFSLVRTEEPVHRRRDLDVGFQDVSSCAVLLDCLDLEAWSHACPNLVRQVHLGLKTPSAAGRGWEIGLTFFDSRLAISCTVSSSDMTSSASKESELTPLSLCCGTNGGQRHPHGYSMGLTAASSSANFLST